MIFFPPGGETPPPPQPLPIAFTPPLVSSLQSPSLILSFLEIEEITTYRATYNMPGFFSCVHGPNEGRCLLVHSPPISFFSPRTLLSVFPSLPRPLLSRTPVRPIIPIFANTGSILSQYCLPLPPCPHYNSSFLATNAIDVRN